MTEGIQGSELVAKLRKARTAYHAAYGVPISPEYARFLEAIGECTDFIERHNGTDWLTVATMVCLHCDIEHDGKQVLPGELAKYMKDIAVQETCPNCKIGDPREFRNGEWQHYIIADEPHWIKCGHSSPAPEVKLHGWQKTLGRADVCPCHGMTNCQLYD